MLMNLCSVKQRGGGVFEKYHLEAASTNDD